MEAPDWDEFFTEIASSDVLDTRIEKLAGGPAQRTARLQRELKDGRTTDIYGAVLEVIAGAGPGQSLTWLDFRTGLEEVLRDKAPQKHEYTHVLRKMSEIARRDATDQETGELTSDPVLDWDPDREILTISDPFFAFQLKWRRRG